MKALPFVPASIDFNRNWPLSILCLCKLSLTAVGDLYYLACRGQSRYNDFGCNLQNNQE